MTTNEIEEMKIKIGEIIEGLEGHCQRRTVDDIATIILAYGEKCREEERDEIREEILDRDITIKQLEQDIRSMQRV